ncbi:MAG TPA: Gfo/Idh/MocA family oxidoreductase [Vicinamibacterales bacterium]|nr:Gfo/Idh/MocA family oxidoreductase [Vicinamibacterales bacterium]
MKVLVAGLGSIGQRHVRNLRALLGTQVEILAYRVRGLPHVITDGMTIAADLTIDEHYRLRPVARLDDALAERPEAVLVCNPTSEHVPTALKAIDAGCAVLIEKPLSDRADGVDGLIERVEGREAIAAVGYQMRFHPALVRLRELLDAGAIGRVVAVRVETGEYLPDAHPYEDYRQGYAARADLGGGVVRCFIHEFDYLYWLFGMPRRLMTMGGRLGALEIDVEDTASTLMECVVDGRPVPVHVQQTLTQRPPSRTCIVSGDAGCIHLDLNGPRLTRSDRSGHVVEDVDFTGFTRNQLFVDELEHFLGSVARRHAPKVTVREAAHSLRIALAARDSMLSRQPVELM